MNIIKPLDFNNHECNNPVCRYEKTRNILLMKEIEYENNREQQRLKYLNNLRAESVIHNLKNVDMLELRRCKKALEAKDKYISELKGEIEKLKNIYGN